MKHRLRQLLIESGGSSNRLRILSAVDERPQNAHQLSEDLNLDYRTVRHHLDILVENRILQYGGENYGRVYLLSDQARHYSEEIEELTDQIE